MAKKQNSRTAQTPRVAEESEGKRALLMLEIPVIDVDPTAYQNSFIEVRCLTRTQRRGLKILVNGLQGRGDEVQTGVHRAGKRVSSLATSSAATPMPTQPARFSVPPRRLRSWGPPRSSGGISTPSRWKSTPIPLGPPNL